MTQSYTSQWGQANTQQVIQNRNSYGISTYGALVLPFTDALGTGEGVNQQYVKKADSLKGKLTTAWNDIKKRIDIKNPTATFKALSEYMELNSLTISEITTGVSTFVGDKLSGIAIAQAIMDGKVTSQEALDYLFLGFAPALGVTGSVLGYSGLNQMKDAFKNGTINVGQFINGFTNVLKSAKQIKDKILNKETRTRGDVIQFDLTVSHSETYTSEAPDRRVQNGQSLQEYIHNLPETFDINCALQEGKRYSQSEFREIMTVIRNRKDVVKLFLGEEMFDSLILTNFTPNSDCTKSGYDYTLSFKKVYRSDITTDREVTIQKIPQDILLKSMESSNSIGGGSNIGSLGKGGSFNIDINQISKDVENNAQKMGISLEDVKNPPSLTEKFKSQTTLKIISEAIRGQNN